MLAIALTWPPSRNFITNGPLQAGRTVFDAVWGDVSRPLSFAYQQQQITDRNLQIKTLNDKLEADRKAAADKDAQVAQLQKQVAALNAQPEAATPAPASAAGRCRRPAPGAVADAAGAASRLGCGPPRRPAVGGHGPRAGRGPGPEAADGLRVGRFRPDVARLRSARSWTRLPPKATPR